jgi:methionine-gamma-lyase
MKNFNPADNIQDSIVFGEARSLHLPIRLSAKPCFDTFEGNMEGCYFIRVTPLIVIYILTKHSCYGRTETANVAASGMGAITPTLLQLCGTGDHIVSGTM